MATFPESLPIVLIIMFTSTVICQEFILISDTLPLGLSKFCAGVFHKQLILFGGQYGPNDISDISSDLYTITISSSNKTNELFSSHEWAKHSTNISQYYASQGCVQTGDRIYGIPHTIQSDHLYFGAPQSLFMYDIPQNQFTNHSLQIPSFWPCVVMFQQQLYVIGTAYTDTTTFKSLQIYDPNNQSWSIGPDLHTPRSSMGCVARSDDIFVFGGQNSNPFQSVTLNSIERFWPGLLAVGAGPWFEQTARLSVNAALLRCIEFMDQIYCAGGSDHVLAGEAMNALNQNMLM